MANVACFSIDSINEYPQRTFYGELEYSLESPRQGDSNEYPQNMFLWITTENYSLIITKYPHLFR